MSAPFGEPSRIEGQPREVLISSGRFRLFDLPSGSVLLINADQLSRFVRRAEGENEIAAVNLGVRRRDAHGEYVVIDRVAFACEGDPNSVALPAETKLAIAARTPLLEVLGFSHSHPGIGVGPSQTDRASFAAYASDAVHLIVDAQRRQIAVIEGGETITWIKHDLWQRRRTRVRRAPETQGAPAFAASVFAWFAILFARAR